MAEIDDFDIDRSIASAWSEFELRLGEIISVIDGTADLTIGTGSEGQQQAPYVRFSSPERDRVRAEAAANAELGSDFQLSAEQCAALVGAGWQPSGDGGGGNFWVERSQEEADQLSALAVGVLRDVYGVQHPIFLAPDQLAEVLQPNPTPIEAGLDADPGTARGVLVPVDREDLQSTLPRGRSHLDELLDAELSQLYGHPPIRDAEGDVAIRVGSTMVFLRTAADGQEVVIFAAVVHDVAGRSRAAEVLNDLNVAARWVKFQLVRDRVFVTFSMLARPFVPAHLHQALRILSDVADGIDEELAVKLHGRTTFSAPEAD